MNVLYHTQTLMIARPASETAPADVARTSNVHPLVKSISLINKYKKRDTVEETIIHPIRERLI